MLLKRMMTTRNVGTLDRILRVLPAVLVAFLWATGTLGGVFAAILAIGAGMLLITSLTGACSIYYLLGWSTCPVSQKPRS